MRISVALVSLCRPLDTISHSVTPQDVRLKGSSTRLCRVSAFSLIEMLAVIGILSLLVGLLLPALHGARESARTLVCKSNLRSLITAMHLYSTDSEGVVVPAYNMRGVTGSRLYPFDGWGPILDRGGYLEGNATLNDNPFACPNTTDVAGMALSQTGSNPDNPKGYMDWPAVFTLSRVYATTLPRKNFDHKIRVSYWINGDNPLGAPRNFQQGTFFTSAVGYGPGANGQIMRPNRVTYVTHPARLIALADGLYSGNQELTRLGTRDSRIGYRHPGRTAQANLAFADGHVGQIEGDKFPRKFARGLDFETIRRENLGSGPTVYAAPSVALNASVNKTR